MNRNIFNKVLVISSFLLVLSHNDAQARDHLVITGSGIVAAVESLYAYQDSCAQQIPLRITIFEKNASVNESTATQIAPSLTPDEIVSVIPRGPVLVEKLGVLFNQPGGIRVDDVAGIDGSAITRKFVSQAVGYSCDEVAHQQRTQALLDLGKMSMDLWQELYETADDELQAIFRASNFNVCRQPKNDTKMLHDGYRIDLIFNVENAHLRALGMKADYEQLGYDQSTLLTPVQVIELDPSLKIFCAQHSVVDDAGVMTWHNDTVALWRPGGCLDASAFVPKIYEYLHKKMGDNFKINCSKHVVGVDYTDTDQQNLLITGLQFVDGTKFQAQADESTEFLFCPGLSVGTLNNLGFTEPAYAGFAGVSLRLNIDISQGYEEQVAHFNHCMEVHQEGVVLAWQARLKDEKISIAVAGTKAFYADQVPDKHQAFAINRNILQLNMINNVLPQFISWAFGYDTTGMTLTEQDLYHLEQAGIARRWAGVRAVAYDGFPTLGHVYKDGQIVANGRVTTHLGSGGVSFAPAAAVVSRSIFKQEGQSQFVQTILSYADCARTVEN